MAPRYPSMRPFMRPTIPLLPVHMVHDLAGTPHMQTRQGAHNCHPAMSPARRQDDQGMLQAVLARNLSHI